MSTTTQDTDTGRWRAWVTLGRVSNLPTVWSNCLAGWLLGGGGSPWAWAMLALGASLLYEAGVLLNDAFDEAYDRRHRPERPLPRGQVKARTVWTVGWSLLGVGVTLLGLRGLDALGLSLLLAAGILLYDATHKHTPLAPILMAACRGLLYLLAAVFGQHGITGLTLWSGLALAVYVAGLSIIARHENEHRNTPRWPLFLLAAPLVLAWVANGTPYRREAFSLSIVFMLWVIPCLRHALRDRSRQVGRTVSGLLAGIVLVDLLAVAGGSPEVALGFACLFLTTLLLQRSIPAT